MALPTPKIAELGIIANDLLAPGARVDTLTVFERSVYFQIQGDNGHGLVALVDHSLSPGPFTIRLDPSALAGKSSSLGGAAFGLDARPQNGSIAVRDGRRRLILTGVPAFDLDDSAIWLPPLTPIAAPAVLDRSLRQLNLLMPKKIAAFGGDDPGLASLALGIKPNRRTPSVIGAEPLIATLTRALPLALTTGHVDRELAQSLTFLVGLGPGLTPSGDDILGGLFIMLTALHQSEVRDKLWDTIAPEIHDLTNEISAMHLAVAADGCGSQLVHDFIVALMTDTPNAIEDTLDRLATIGHSSGLDTAAGCAIATAAWLAARSKRNAFPGNRPKSKPNETR